MDNSHARPCPGNRTAFGGTVSNSRDWVSTVGIVQPVPDELRWATTHEPGHHARGSPVPDGLRWRLDVPHAASRQAHTRRSGRHSPWPWPCPREPPLTSGAAPRTSTGTRVCRHVRYPLVRVGSRFRSTHHDRLVPRPLGTGPYRQTLTWGCVCRRHHDCRPGDCRLGAGDQMLIISPAMPSTASLMASDIDGCGKMLRPTSSVVMSHICARVSTGMRSETS